MNIITFLQEVQSEVKKVNWPSREETMRNTLIVVLFAVAVALFLGFFDYIFGLLLSIVVR